MGLGLAFGLVWVALGVTGVAAAVLAASLNLIWLVVAVIAVFAVIFVLLALVQAALSGIYSAALYRFATRGEAGGMFERRELEAAFEPR